MALQERTDLESRSGKRSPSATRCRSHSLVELKQTTLRALQEKLEQADADLGKRSEENQELKKYIHNMNQECLELHAKVFEEANAMVQAALASQDKAERLAQDCSMENELLREEIRELKDSLSLNCSPPQQSFAGFFPSLASKKTNVNGTGSTKFLAVPGLGRTQAASGQRQHKRSASSHEVGKTLANGGILKPQLVSVDSGFYLEFLKWLDASPKLFCPAEESSHATAFLRIIVHEDVLPCLNFECATTTQRLLRALPNIDFTILPIRASPSFSLLRCPLVLNKPCEYLLRFQDSINTPSDTNEGEEVTEEVQISLFARQRIVAVCNLYQYLTLIDRGLVRTACKEDLFRTIQNYRRLIGLARLGYDMTEEM